jgi:hypothetical protein
MAPPKSKEEKVAADLAAELERKDYASVMRELVGKTKQGKRKSPRKDDATENKPNQYW